jgi:hypothetical protein
MSKLVPYKFEVVAVCHVVNDDGDVVAEQPVGQHSEAGMRPVTLFGVAGLSDWAAGFQGQLDGINARQTGSD